VETVLNLRIRQNAIAQEISILHGHDSKQALQARARKRPPRNHQFLGNIACIELLHDLFASEVREGDAAFLSPKALAIVCSTDSISQYIVISLLGEHLKRQIICFNRSDRGE
jgi:hypothetical protein